MSNVKEGLRLGIQAVRTGKEKEARKHFIAVLKQDPDNIPAMLWLAFILPSPHDTIRLLKRVLSLDPENERAKAGIRWAEKRLRENPDDNKPLTQNTPEKTIDQSGDFVRQQLLSEDVQEKAKKGALAHRARRTINPLLVFIILLGVIGMIFVGLSVLFVPPETLAAFLPTATQNTLARPQTIIFEPVTDLSQTTVAKQSFAGVNFTSTRDILDLSTRKMSRASVEADVTDSNYTTESNTKQPDISLLLADIEESLPELATTSQTSAEMNLTGIDPSALIGSELSEIEEDPLAAVAPLPVENLLLAHQPAYPDEKWIEVNVTTQQVTAWEGNVPVMSFIASTGLPNTPTVLGEYNIYWKLESTLMVGADYYLPEVPYTMYFYRGYSLHGTYWHDNFGQPMSHGCVNLETGNAKKLFEWAAPVIPPGQNEVVATADNPGTLVVVHQ